MAQTSITNYFNKRKRPGDEIKNRRKVLVLDHVSEADISISEEVHVIHKVGLSDSEALHSVYESKTLVQGVSNDNGNKLLHVNTKSIPSGSKAPEKHIVQKSFQRKSKKANIQPSNSKKQSDIRHILLKTNGAETNNGVQPTSCTTLKTEHTSAKYGTALGPECSTSKENNPSPIEGHVVFELKGSLSPKKKLREAFINRDKSTNDKISDAQESCVESNLDGTFKEGRRELGLMTPHKMGSHQHKELSYDELKGKLNRSEKLAELRKSLSRFDKKTEKLKELEQKRNPQLKKFEAIEIEVPASPQKNIYSSPQKVGTSSQSTPTKSPAYQRIAAFALPARAALSLPSSYCHLMEIFRCVDVVVSMLYKRREEITFKKLKPAVQEMLRRNFTEHHLAQIKRAYPGAYAFHQEKCRSFGYTPKADQYHLTLIPLLHTKGSENCTDPAKFTSDCLLERRQTFHENLLEKAKEYHEKFLQGLDPPLVIPRNRLTRWHPGFDVDQVPEIEPDPLPEPPNMEKIGSAKDVLLKARNLLSCNPRMLKALESVSENSSQSEVTTTPTKLVNKDPATSPISAMLKGIPKALIEKIRAKQAVKALEAMTRSPAQDRVATQHMRLPELARILRNLYVTEKKNVLPLAFALETLGNSYLENLSRVELEEHIHLLRNAVPGWLEILYIRKTNYLKLSKNADMALVMKKLETLAAEKNGR